MAEHQAISVFSKKTEAEEVCGLILRFQNHHGTHTTQDGSYWKENYQQEHHHDSISGRRGGLSKVGWEGDGSQIVWVEVEVWEEPTVHRVNVAKMLQWLKLPGRTPRDVVRKDKLRKIGG